MLAIFLAAAAGFIFFWSSAVPASELSLNKFEDVILNQIDSYILVINGARDLVTSENVSLASWRNYFSKLNIRNNYPSISSIAFSEKIFRSEAADYLKSLRNSYNDAEIRIFPETESSELLVLKYIEASTPEQQRAVGLNVLTRPNQLAAIESAIKTGLPTASGRTVFQVTNRTGFSILEPVYRSGAPISSEKERQEAFSGVIGAGLSSHDFFGAVLKNLKIEGLRIRIYDSADFPGDDFLYDTDPSKKTFEQEGIRKIGVLNRTWIIAYEKFK